jgi:toxin FitB
VSGALLDTSILIARALPGDALPPSAAISVVSLGELRAGVLLARTRQIGRHREERLQAIRRAFAALSVDADVSEHYGGALAVAGREKRTAKATDLLIIATAAATSRTLYTCDTAQARLGAAYGIEVNTI